AHGSRPHAHRSGIGDSARARAYDTSTIANERGRSPRSNGEALMAPLHRPRRTRQSDAWRRMVRETRLSLDALIYPLFVVPGRGVRHAVQSMPGISQLSVDEVVKDAKAAAAAGVPEMLCSPAPAEKDAKASSALDPKGLAAQAIAAIKDACPQLLVWADVCLCGSTDHGHCGHVTSRGAIENDTSIKTLAQVALNYARAG